MASTPAVVQRLADLTVILALGLVYVLTLCVGTVASYVASLARADSTANRSGSRAARETSD